MFAYSPWLRKLVALPLSFLAPENYSSLTQEVDLRVLLFAQQSLVSIDLMAKIPACEMYSRLFLGDRQFPSSEG
jgi:hypothetical protein